MHIHVYDYYVMVVRNDYYDNCWISRFKVDFSLEDQPMLIESAKRACRVDPGMDGFNNWYNWENLVQGDI
jgi:hypothetical protein